MSLKKAVFWSYLLTTGSMTITGVLTFVLAAILDPESFGVLALGMFWVGLAQILLQHGPTLAVQQLEKITDEQINAAFWTTIAGAGLFSAVLALFAPLWGLYNGLSGLAPVTWALILVTLFTSVSVIPDAVLRREMRFKGIAVRALAGAGIGGTVGVIGALAGWGVWALVVQQIVAYGIYSVAVWKVLAWRPSFPRWRNIRDEMRVMRAQSVHSLGGAIGAFFAMRMDVLLMGAFFGPVMIGLYRFALRLAELVVDATSRGLQQVSLPELARHQSDPAALGRRLADLVHLAVVMSVPALAVLAAVASPLVSLVGPQWSEAAAPLQLLCAVSALGAVNQLLGPAMQAVGRASVPAVLTWVTAILSGLGIGAAALLTRDAGTVAQLTAVALAALIVQAVMLIANVVLAYRIVLHVPLLPTIRAIGPALTAAAAGFGCAWLGVKFAGPSPLPAFFAGGAAGGLAALAILALADPLARRYARTIGTRLRRRPAPNPAA